MAEEREELLALGAAGALTPDEMVELERLLADDPRAAAEYAALLDDITVLADSVAEQPPVRLRAAILEAIADETQVSASAPPASESIAPLAPPPYLAPVESVPPPPAVAPVVPIHRRRWWVPAIAVAAAIVLVVGALVVTRDADAPSDDMMAAVLDDDDAVTVELTGAAGELRLVKSEEYDATVLVGDDIVAPDAEQVLQLWAIADGQPTSMGTFVPEDDGQVAFVMEGTEPEGTQYAVSIEPEGGSEQPTGDIVAGPA